MQNELIDLLKSTGTNLKYRVDREGEKAPPYQIMFRGPTRKAIIQVAASVLEHLSCEPLSFKSDNVDDAGEQPGAILIYSHGDSLRIAEALGITVPPEVSRSTVESST